MTRPQPSRPPRAAVTAAGETTSTFLDRQWRIEMPAGQELLNANDRIHWSKRARITKQLRSDAHVMARYLKIPRLARARITCLYEPPDARRRDAGNWYPTFKAHVDGLVDAGVVADDDHTRVDGPHMYIGDPFPKGRIVLIITELDPSTRRTPS